MSASPQNSADSTVLAATLNDNAHVAPELIGAESVMAVDSSLCQTADDWVFDDQLQDAARLIQSASKQLGVAKPLAASGAADPVGETIRKWHHHLATPTPLPHFQPSHAKYERPIRQEPLRSHMLLSVSLLVSTGGAAGLGWAFLSPANDPWGAGMPITVCCLLVMFFGLIFHLNLLLRSNRATTWSPDDRLKRLDTTPPRSADGSFSRPEPSPPQAAPELLLADMKRQLDALTQQLDVVRR